ncbi:MAG: SURF1 family cytochrome oxidase biogenesis protein [Qipengyuania sp.]
MPRLPVIPTLLVAAAVATMIALGIWQLGRAEEKEALVARAEWALTMSSEVEYARDEPARERVLYRRTSIECQTVLDAGLVAGTSASGAKGWAHRYTCALPDGGQARVDLGFSREPNPFEWSGGALQGLIAPGGRIVAANPPAGLAPLAPPDPRDLPNNHLAYAGQWFFFAVTALVIYFLALRHRRRRPSLR